MFGTWMHCAPTRKRVFASPLAVAAGIYASVVALACPLRSEPQYDVRCAVTREGRGFLWASLRTKLNGVDSSSGTE